MPELLSPSFPLQPIELLELPTGHCPNWSRPNLVGELLTIRPRDATSTTERGPAADRYQPGPRQ